MFIFAGTLLHVRAHICEVGSELDESNTWRWVLPHQHPCECTEIIMGGVNTWTPIGSFKPTYVNTHYYQMILTK